MAFDRRDARHAADAPTDDVRVHLGQAYVPVGEVRDCSVVDAARLACLEAWCDRLVPGDEHWPSASDVGAAAYIDAVAARAPGARPVLLGAIDALEGAARARHARAFRELDAGEQHELVAELADHGARGGFDLVLELTYEAYYRDPAVNAAMEERTGFRPALTHLGSPMEPFDDALLARVRELPASYRSIET